MPEVNGLCGEGHEVSDRGKTVEQEEPLAQGNVLLILVQDLQFVIIDLSDGLAGLLLLFEDVFF